MFQDPYTYSQVMLSGGPAGLYVIESPFSGDEYEYNVLTVTTGHVAGPYYAFVSAMQPPPALAYDGSVAFGSQASAPLTFLPAQAYAAAADTTIPGSDNWVRVPNGNKYVYIRAVTPASSSAFVSIQFRFLPVRVIPGRSVTVPDVAEQQYNEARADKVIERLEMDIEKGDKGAVPYGRLS